MAPGMGVAVPRVTLSHLLPEAGRPAQDVIPSRAFPRGGPHVRGKQRDGCQCRYRDPWHEGGAAMAAQGLSWMGSSREAEGMPVCCREP